jgi:hypothetical protein
MANAQSKTTFVDPPGFKASEAVTEQDDNEVQAEIDAADEADDEGEAEERQERAEASDDKGQDVEARARKMGWRPKSEYEASGRDTSKFVSAEEFIRRGENELPVIRERFRKLEKLTDKQAKEISEGTQLLRDLVANQKAERDKAVKKAIAELTTKRKEASAVGDADAVEAISGEIEEQKAELKKPVEAEREQKQEVAKAPPELIAWVEANKSWFEGDPEAHDFAVSVYGRLQADDSLTETERLAQTRARVAKRFPEHFTNTRRAQPGAVEAGNGGGGIGRGRAAQKGWGDLPRDAQDIGERLIKQGAVKDKAAYLKDYAW